MPSTLGSCMQEAESFSLDADWQKSPLIRLRGKTVLRFVRRGILTPAPAVNGLPRLSDNTAEILLAISEYDVVRGPTTVVGSLTWQLNSLC